jgi:hypothetical protein
MNLSALQKYILKTCHGEGKALVKGKFEKFYVAQKIVPGKDEQIKIISRSIDRLINKGLLVGYGEKTRARWFIKEIELTATGKRLARKFQGEQTKLPFKK